MKIIKNLILSFIKLISLITFPFYMIFRNLIRPIYMILKSENTALYLKLKGGKVGKNFRIGSDSIMKVNAMSKVIIGNNVIIGDDVFINVKNDAKLYIGNNVHINKGTRISSFESIIIEDDVLIASYCNILDHNHQYDLKSPASTVKYDCSPIIIKKGAWLGTKVQVNKGTTIGKFSIIASNSVVTKNIEESCIYGGIPATKIKCLKK